MNERTVERTSTQLEAHPNAAWTSRPLAVVAAIVINIVILTIGRLVNGEFPVAKVGSDDQTIGYVPVILVTAVVGLVAWGLLALLVRTTSRPALIWIVIAVVIFLLSLTGPLGSGVGTSSKVVLFLLHVGAAVPIIPMMYRSAR